MKKYKATLIFELPFDDPTTDEQCGHYVEHLLKQAQVSFREWYTKHMTAYHNKQSAMHDRQVSKTVAASCKQDESIIGKSIKSLKVEAVVDEDGV